MSINTYKGTKQSSFHGPENYWQATYFNNFLGKINLTFFGLLIFALINVNSIIFSRSAEQESYWLHKKTSIHQGLSFFLQREPLKNKQLLEELLFCSGNKLSKTMLKDLEEDWVIAQILCEEFPLLNEELEKDPQRFLVSLLLCSIAGDKEQFRTDLLLQKKKWTKRRVLLATISLLIAAGLCYNHRSWVRRRGKAVLNYLLRPWMTDETSLCSSPPGSPRGGCTGKPFVETASGVFDRVTRFF